MEPFDEWLKANQGWFPTPMEYFDAVDAARAAFKAGVALGVRSCTRAYHPTATVPGPTFTPLTADLRAPLNEAGERVGPARERREDAAALVARLTAGDRQ
jgi:hypothetical protein